MKTPIAFVHFIAQIPTEKDIEGTSFVKSLRKRGLPINGETYMRIYDSKIVDTISRWAVDKHQIKRVTDGAGKYILEFAVRRNGSDDYAHCWSDIRMALAGSRIKWDLIPL